MNIQKVFLAGAVFAFAAPAAVFAQDASTQVSAQALAQAQAAALNDLTPEHRGEVKNILALEQSKQLDKGSAAVQIDAVLSDDETKAVLAEAAKVHSDASDAGVFLASF